MQALKSLEPGWERLAAAASPMQQFIWIEAFAESFGEAARLRMVAVGPEGEPWALAPLVERRGLAARLESLAAPELFEPMDLVYGDPQSAWLLGEALVREGRALYLPRLPAHSPVIPALRAACRGRGLVRVAPTTGYPYIALDESWKNPEGRFNAGRRSDFRRAARHAERLGKVELEVLAPTEAELPALLDAALAVEAAGWKGAAGSAMARNERVGAFFRRWAAAACRRGILRLAFLRIGGVSAAMQLAAECAGGFWLFKIGHDERFQKASPGSLLMLHTVRYAAERGLRSYEFLGAIEPWTDVWTKAVRECVAVRVYPYTAPGLTTLASDGVRYLGRRLWARTPAAPRAAS